MLPHLLFFERCSTTVALSHRRLDDDFFVLLISIFALCFLTVHINRDGFFVIRLSVNAWYVNWLLLRSVSIPYIDSIVWLHPIAHLLLLTDFSTAQYMFFFFFLFLFLVILLTRIDCIMLDYLILTWTSLILWIILHLIEILSRLIFLFLISWLSHIHLKIVRAQFCLILLRLGTILLHLILLVFAIHLIVLMVGLFKLCCELSSLVPWRVRFLVFLCLIYFPILLLAILVMLRCNCSCSSCPRWLPMHGLSSRLGISYIGYTHWINRCWLLKSANNFLSQNWSCIFPGVVV